MKVPPRQIAAFLKRPDPSARAILVYGPDTGLVRERAEVLARTVLERLDDPFRVAELVASALADDPARLADEAAAISFTGGRRVVRVREAGDRHTEVFREFFRTTPGEALVVVEAGDLGPRSSLRRLFETAPAGAALPCYADNEATLAGLVRTVLGEHDLTIEADALEHLVRNLGGDRQVSRRELEKLVLYMASEGPNATVRLADVQACVGDGAAVGLEDVAFAAAGGDAATLDRALSRCFDGGESPVAVLRAAAGHLQRLQLARALHDSGDSVEAALKALKPPVFFKRGPAFKAQLGAWTTAHLAAAIEIITEAELYCKTTGMPAAAICRQALFRISANARAGPS